MKRQLLWGTLSALALGAMLASAAVPGAARGFGPDGHGPRGAGIEPPSFAELDADGNGGLTADEMTAFGRTRFDETDSDGNGSLSAEELAAEVLKMRQEAIASRAEQRMRVLDENGDGELSFDEMADSRNIDRLFRFLDADGNGEVSAEEYAAVAQMHGGPGPFRMRQHGNADN